MRVRDFTGVRVEDLTTIEEEDDDIGVLTTNAAGREAIEVTRSGLGLWALMFVVCLDDNNCLISVISRASFSSVKDSSLTRFRISPLSVPFLLYLRTPGRFF